MVSPFHRNIEQGIYLAGIELIKDGTVQKVFRGNKVPLGIMAHTPQKHSITYKPDVYYILRNNKKKIFEVLDSEEEKQDIIIADIIRSFFD